METMKTRTCKPMLILLLLALAASPVLAKPALEWDGYDWLTMTEEQRAYLCSGLVIGSYSLLLWLKGHGFQEAVNQSPLDGQLDSAAIVPDITAWYKKTQELDWPVAVIFFLVNQERYSARQEDYYK